MIIIGEKLNGAIPAVAKAIAERDAEFILLRSLFPCTSTCVRPPIPLWRWRP